MAPRVAYQPTALITTPVGPRALLEPRSLAAARRGERTDNAGAAAPDGDRAVGDP